MERQLGLGLEVSEEQSDGAKKEIEDVGEFEDKE